MRWSGPILPAVVFAAIAASVDGFGQPMQSIAEARSILREASTLVPKIEEPQQSSAAANIAGRQAKAGDLAGALATLQSVGREQDQGVALYCVSWALTTDGNWRTVLQIIADHAKGTSKALAYSAVVDRLADKGDYKDALAVAEILREVPDSLSTYIDALMRICAAQGKAGHASDASRTLDHALDAAEHVREVSDNPVSQLAARYRNCIWLLAATGNSTLASVVVERLSAMAGQERDPSLKQFLLGELAPALAVVGDFSGALRSAEQIAAGGSRDVALLSILGEQVKQGDLAGARLLAAEVSQKSWTDSALQQFAYALDAAEDSPGALATIDKMQAAGERARGLAQLALQQAERSDPAAAVTVPLALEAAQVAGIEGEPYAFEFIAVTKAMLGDFPGSLEILGSLDEKARVWPIWNLSAMLVAAGKKSEALALAHAQEAPEPRAYALLGTASQLIEQIEAERAKAGAAK